jgi:hypothetical protein
LTALGEYLAAAARRPWAPPTWDCCVFLADWCVAVGYDDPMAFIRGRYASEAEALELAKRPGLLRLATRGFRDIGLARTRQPIDGDVAVLRRPTVDGLDVVCAIRSGERWVSLLERGLLVDASGTLLRAWRVEWARQ